MTAAERKRRSRAYDTKLRETMSAVKLAAMLGGSPQFFRDMEYIQHHGVPEWDQMLENSKGQLVLGASTQRQMVKYLSPDDQREIIAEAKKDKKKALAIWRLIKGDLGIK